MKVLSLKTVMAAVLVGIFSFAAPPADAASTGKSVKVTGEVIDTWCYYSGVMGGPDAVVGTAHHTCALWCAAGGIPVGLLAEDGTVYMVLKLEDSDDVHSSDRFLDIQSDVLVAQGTHFKRDGVNYLVVDKVIDNLGITNKNHEDFGIVPPFAVKAKKAYQ